MSVEKNSRVYGPDDRYYMCINRSGESLTVYANTALSEKRGTLKPNDVFAWINVWAGSHAYFDTLHCIYWKGAYGYIFAEDYGNVFTYVTRHDAYDIEMDGHSYNAFELRRDAEVYNPAGKKIGVLRKGGYAAASYAICGSSMPYLMYVDYYGATEPSEQKAFIDMGLRSHASYDDVNFILNL